MLQTHQHISWPGGLHLGQSLNWIQLIGTQTLSYFRKDQLAGPQGRRVQIDTDLLLLKHICQTEAPWQRDRCWWSKLLW